MTKSHILDEIIPLLYLSLFKVTSSSLFHSYLTFSLLSSISNLDEILLFQFVHEVAMIEESFQGFIDLSRTLKDQLETAKAQKEEAKGLK